MTDHKQLTKQFELHRDYIVHEDNLVNYRIGWLITLNSFLFIPTGMIVSGINQSSSLPFALPLVSLFGIFSIIASINTFLSVLAAHDAIYYVRKNWEKNYGAASAESFPFIVAGRKGTGVTRAGSIGSRVLPLVLAVLWALIVVYLKSQTGA